MKESISGVSLFIIVIAFIILFTGYIALSVNYAKSFNVKNELVNIIKNRGGICTGDMDSSGEYNCDNFTEQISDYFKETNYSNRGTCESGWIGINSDGEYLGNGASGAAFCIRGVRLNYNSNLYELTNSVYYKVKVFWHLDIPIFSLIFNFTVNGETPVIYDPNECKVDSHSYLDCWGD